MHTGVSKMASALHLASTCFGTFGEAFLPSLGLSPLLMNEEGLDPWLLSGLLTLPVLILDILVV